MTFYFGAVEQDSASDSGISSLTDDRKIYTCNICHVKRFSMQAGLFQHQRELHPNIHMQRLNILLYDLYDDEV